MSSPAGVPGTRAGSNCKLKRFAVYVCRGLDRSAAYQVVRESLETWLAHRRAGRLVAGANWVEDAVPGYAERDLRKFIECGILAHGFARARRFIPRALATTKNGWCARKLFLVSRALRQRLCLIAMEFVTVRWRS